MEKTDNTITIKELYEKVENAVNTFAKDFTSLLPVSDKTHVSRMIILNDIVGLKEKSKLLINTYVLAEQGDANAGTDKEDK